MALSVGTRKRDDGGAFWRDRRSEAPIKPDGVDLSPDDIQTLHERVRRRSYLLAGRGWPVVRLVGGPLDGLRVKLEPQAARGDFIGFCQLTEKRWLKVLAIGTRTRYGPINNADSHLSRFTMCQRSIPSELTMSITTSSPICQSSQVSSN